jgi:two-component system LytT family response regulator
MIKAIIIDDEEHCVTALKNDIKMFCPDISISDSCYSGKDGILSIRKNLPDLVFLDIEMPGMNGFEMLEILDRNINFQIIFTTAYDQFAVKAFKVSAVDYLLKPIDGDDLINAVLKARKSLTNDHSHTNITNLLHNSKASVDKTKIALPNRDGYDFITVSQIIYCKANGAYTNIILSGNKSLLLSKSLGETEQMLPEKFFERIHHSVIVNIKHIQHLKKTNSSSIVMDNGDELSVSKSKKEQLLLRLGVK